MTEAGDKTQASASRISEDEVRDALMRIDPLWDELFPAEQARIVQLLVARVDIRTDGVVVSLRTDGLGSLVADVGTGSFKLKEAA